MGEEQAIITESDRTKDSQENSKSNVTKLKKTKKKIWKTK